LLASFLILFIVHISYGSGSDSADDKADSEEEVPKVKASEKAKTPQPNQKKGSILPSVESLFSNTNGPTFLAQPKNEENFVVKPMKKRKADDDIRDEHQSSTVIGQPSHVSAAEAPKVAVPTKINAQTPQVAAT